MKSTQSFPTLPQSHSNTRMMTDIASQMGNSFKVCFEEEPAVRLERLHDMKTHEQCNAECTPNPIGPSAHRRTTHQLATNPESLRLRSTQFGKT